MSIAYVPTLVEATVGGLLIVSIVAQPTPIDNHRTASTNPGWSGTTNATFDQRSLTGLDSPCTSSGLYVRCVYVLVHTL